jgi:SH3 domain protein
MKTTNRPCALVVSLWLSLLMVSASAETVYVSGRFEIGVHDDIKFDSVILAVIASGTPLTVIARNGDFVQVGTPDGTTGWVDARYIVSERPGVALRDGQDDELRKVMRSLGDARADVEVLRQRITELRRDVATAAQDAPDIAESNSLADNEDSAKLKEAQRALENLAEENRELKTRLTDLQASRGVPANLPADSEAKKRPGPLDSIMRGPLSNETQSWTPWRWLLFGSILLLSFATGGYMVDWESRRRHGGFRV